MTYLRLAVVVHGWGGTPSDAWLPWLKAELEVRDYAAIVPAMPNTNTPEITPWLQTLRSTLANTSAQEVVLVGHSIGCQTILRYLAEAYVPVAKAIFVAGWVELTGLDDEEIEVARPWLQTPINVPIARAHMKSSAALFSSNDPVVPLKPNRHFFEDHVGSEVVELDNYGHFDGESGITSIPEILQFI